MVAVSNVENYQSYTPIPIFPNLETIHYSWLTIVLRLGIVFALGLCVRLRKGTFGAIALSYLLTHRNASISLRLVRAL